MAFDTEFIEKAKQRLDCFRGRALFQATQGRRRDARHGTGISAGICNPTRVSRRTTPSSAGVLTCNGRPCSSLSSDLWRFYGRHAENRYRHISNDNSFDTPRHTIAKIYGDNLRVAQAQNRHGADYATAASSRTRFASSSR